MSRRIGFAILAIAAGLCVNFGWAQINTGRISGSHVVTVSDDDDQLDDALRAAGADLLGGQYPYARAGFVRHPLRATSRGAGRDRWR